ncbi:MAG: hypothetical protein QGI42_06980, partial [Rhodospirillales bacterium]|nr:hypothetical protein [Rhodospirillales bacterium]
RTDQSNWDCRMAEERNLFYPWLSLPMIGSDGRLSGKCRIEFVVLNDQDGLGHRNSLYHQCSTPNSRQAETAPAPVAVSFATNERKKRTKTLPSGKMISYF